MSRSGSNKTTGATSRSSIDNGQDYRIANIYQRLDEKAREDSLVEISWSTTRRPDVAVPPQPLSDELGDAWPSASAPRKVLKPRPGFSAPTVTERSATVFVCLFGLTPEKIEAAVAVIERRYRATRDFRPLFLTDQSNNTPIRHAGFSYEYFPPAIYGSENSAGLFQKRFHRLWQKWKGDNLIDFSTSGYLAQRLEDMDQFIKDEQIVGKRFNPRKKKSGPFRKPTTDVIALRADYVSSGLDAVPDTFVLYRILGNDLPPRHEVGQTLTNLRFLLDHEPELASCEKRWVVNRIVDPEQEAAIIALLEDRNQPYLHIPFVLEEYAQANWDLASFPGDAFFLRGHYHDMHEYDQLRAEAHVRRFKNNYLIHNNGARNAALRDGRDRAKWVLPWDGNCFLTEGAWSEIVESVTTKPYLKYFTVPMSRTIDNDDLLQPDYRPDADEEPQILFRRDAEEEFNENFYYGRRPKVELFYRLGIPGKWDDWPDDVWDLPRAPRSEDAGTSGEAGWVARLFSGQKELEADKTMGLRNRGEARIAAITAMLDRHDVAALSLTYSPDNLTAYDEAAVTALPEAAPGSPEHQVFDRLVLEADLALQRGPYSVVDKTSVPPSGDKHDYYHPAPYWWPNPATPSGMPFQFRDGERIPGTRLYEPESALYDRTRLQRMFDDTTVLALGWLATRESRYIEHAAKLIRTWFLDETTRMNPHLLYSQVRSQTINDVGAKSGLIEMKDLYYLLDAARLVERAGCLSSEEQTRLRDWLKEYLEWLQTSDQGTEERLTNNNHGTCFDLQTGAIAAFLGDMELLEKTFFASRQRILEQFTRDGQQPHEMTRTQTAHYCCFNLQCWINLATLADACGHDLWSFEGKDGRGLAQAFAWLLPHLSRATWKYKQIEPFDRGRFLPIFYTARSLASDQGSLHMTEPSQARPVFFAHDGIKPFWMLTRAPSAKPETSNWKSVSGLLNKLEQPVAELCKGAAFAKRGGSDARELDKKLWGGFSQSAKQELTILRDGFDIDPKERTRAARTLARWSFVQGDLQDVLSNTEAMSELGVTGERERALLRAYCLDELGQPEVAAAELEAPLAQFLNDANLFFAQANVVRSSPNNGGASDAWGGWINRIYRLNKMPDLVRDAPQIDFVAPQASALFPEHDGSDTHVTAILTIENSASAWEQALRSLQNQTWRNMTIVIAQCSGDRSFKQKLEDRAGADPRLKIVDIPQDTSASVMRNTALDAVEGMFVVFQAADEYAHPSKIAEQVKAFHDDETQCAISQSMRMREDGHVIAEWSPDFRLITDHAAGAMFRTEALRHLGGWDSVYGNAEAFLLWRLKKSMGQEAVTTVRTGMPLTVLLDAVETQRPAHLEFPFGQLRNDFRALLRREKRANDESVPAQDAAPRVIPPYDSVSRGLCDVFDTVFVGDFSSQGAAIEQLSALLSASVQSHQTAGLFHWPDYDTTWGDDLEQGIADLVDAGALRQISAFESVKTQRLVLCNPFVVHHQIDGYPIIEAQHIDVLFGPEFHVAEFDDGLKVSLPTQNTLEQHFNMPVHWKTL